MALLPATLTLPAAARLGTQYAAAEGVAAEFVGLGMLGQASAALARRAEVVREMWSLVSDGPEGTAVWEAYRAAGGGL